MWTVAYMGQAATRSSISSLFAGRSVWRESAHLPQNSSHPGGGVLNRIVLLSASEFSRTQTIPLTFPSDQSGFNGIGHHPLPVGIYIYRYIYTNIPPLLSLSLKSTPPWLTWLSRNSDKSTCFRPLWLLQCQSRNDTTAPLVELPSCCRVQTRQDIRSTYWMKTTISPNPSTLNQTYIFGLLIVSSHCHSSQIFASVSTGIFFKARWAWTPWSGN